MKKIIGGILLLFSLLLVSCHTTSKDITYTISYHVEEDTSIVTNKSYAENTILNQADIHFEKTGYELEKWYLDVNHTNEVVFPYTVTKNEDFYAEWIKIHTISLFNGTATLKTEKVKDGQVFSNPGNPQITGAGVFKGWSSNKDSFVQFDFETPIHQDLSLYAFFEEIISSKTFTISFMNGETLVEGKTVQENTTVEAIAGPSKTGYTFKGWSSDKETYTPFDFATEIDSDLSLYAFYEINQYTVTYMCRTETYHTETVSYNTSTTAPQNPNLIGFTFICWCKDSDGQQPFDFETPITEDITLYAKVEAVATHTLHLVIDGVTTDTQINSNAVLSTITVPTKEGYTLVGWYTDANYQNAFDASTPITEDKTLYAYYQINTYTITFKNENTTVAIKTVEHNAKVTTPTAPSKAGHTFKGWSTNATTYTAFDPANTPITENITLYAFFDINQYTVTFMNGNTTVATKTVDYNTKVPAPTTPSKAGYTFKGWSSNTTTYTAFDISTTPITENKTLYAFFDINQYTVTFINGSTTLSSKLVDHNSKVTAPASPTKIGYTFKGWSTNATTYTAFDPANTPITENKTLYAFFDINQYTVTFMNGNVQHDSKTVNYNDTVALPSQPSQTGKTFKGWSTNATTFTAFDENTKITANKTLYAFFITEYTVTFNVEGTKTTVTVEENSTVARPENPKKSGYAFMYWTLDNTEFNFSTPITENIELVAYFEEAQIDITEYSAYDEGLFFEATPIAGASLSDYQVQYKLTTASASSWKTVDSALIREENNKIRCDIVGLSAGEYDVKITASGKSRTLSYTVTALDRSGYAHFNYSGVGGYNDDGTLKSNAIVVYVTNDNKNTVSITESGKTYTGLVSILQNQKKFNKPLVIRIIGKITTNQYAYKSDAPRLPDGSNNTSTFFTNSLESTYGENLVGLTVQYMDKLAGRSYKYLTTKTGLTSNGTGDSTKKTTTYSRTDYPALTGKTVLDDDSYFNMLDVSDASNITLEGIGTNAEFFQFGLTWKTCNSIEVKNLTFTDYPEDACSFEGGSNSDVNNYGHYWVHHNTFNRGKNNWDLSGERDKYAGDGGIDVKYINSVTLAYNKFNNCKKTGLVGGDNKNYTKNITFHHNYYYNVESRLPLGRQANMHIYNNYYEQCGTCQDIRANAFVFSEANYFDNCTTAQKVSTDSTYTGTVIKSYNDYYNGDSKKNTTQATKVNSRTQSLTGNCKPDGSTDYTNFDTNSSLFYYTGSASNVTVLHKNTDVPAYCKSHSGAGLLKSTDATGGTTPPEPTPDVEWTNRLNETFSSSATITHREYSTTPPTTSGIYYSYNGGTNGSTANNNVSITNNELLITDLGDSTTYGYYIFNQQFNTGKVKISIDFKPQTANSKWPMIHFLDGSSNLRICTDASTYLSYSTDGGTTMNAICADKMQANVIYTIILIIDYDSNKATVQIGSETKTFAYSNTITGIMFQTAGNNARTFSVDNIKIDTAS